MAQSKKQPWSPQQLSQNPGLEQALGRRHHSPLKTLSFSRSSLNLSQKNNNLRLIHRWIIVKFKHHVHDPVPSILTVGNFKIMSEIIGKTFAL